VVAIDTRVEGGGAATANDGANGGE
jgi:hypothetical protein